MKSTKSASANIREAGGAEDGVSNGLVIVPRPSRRRKIRGTFYLPTDLFEEIRDAAVHLSGPPLRLTLARLAEIGLRRELGRLKQMHNSGRDFPRRSEDLKGGRPIGS